MMTIGVLFGFLTSFLWGLTNHIDKYMLSGIDKNKNNIKVLLVFSSFIAGVVLSPIWLIFSHFKIEISVTSLTCVLTASFVYVLATYSYLKAIEKNDTSIIVIMFQLIPVFSYIFALILFDEKLSLHQILGSILIILSAVIISFDFNNKNNTNRFKALGFMTLSSLFYATYFILFDIAIRESSYYSCAFWYQLGFLFIGIFLLCMKSFRLPFVNAIKKNGKKYIYLNITNEGLNLIGNLLVNYANLTLPVALAVVLTGFEGAFAFIIGLLGTVFIPKYIKEDINKTIIIQKTACILLGIIGLIILVY